MESLENKLSRVFDKRSTGWERIRAVDLYRSGASERGVERQERKARGGGPRGREKEGNKRRGKVDSNCGRKGAAVASRRSTPASSRDRRS